ncbi:DEKNAAC104500 [Brettanomyces naardenensis]|uniref:DEKNAAC104500 n=1 Tax=Brettanomyces naardenensis TaxID=13370 RepID=A0A448YRB8_BRENA|nr:DEKNAAC104500 [Brettanomyces naardenensis]
MSILGSRDSKLSKLFTKTKGRIHGQQADSSDQSSVTTYGSSNSSATTAADIKRHEKLSIQTSTSLLPSSSKDSRSPLARTSKEVERIAGYTNAPPTIPERFTVSSNISQPAKSWTKHRSHLHLLRPRKDSLKSSSNSNSMFVSRDGGETMYSFHPSAVGTSLSTNELQSMLQELEKLSSGNGPLTEDKDAIADEAWNIFCSLVSPIFEGGRIRAPVEEINKLVYLHMKLCAAGVSNEASTAISQVPPYTPLTAPAPTFSTIYPTSSPTPSSHTLTPTLTPLGGYSKVAEEVQYFLKGGMVSLMSLLYYDDTERTIKLHSSPSKRRRGLRSNSLSNSADTALFSSNINFEKSCSLLWDTFYDDIYFYLQGVFLPLESGGVSFDESSTSSKSETGRIPVSDMVLVSFRDNVVIPLYEMNRQAETEKERRREHGNTVTSMASGISFIGSTGSKNSTKLHSASPVNLDADDMAQAYSLNLALLQCFTILNGVQTNDTNQKIIENLMQQTRERCLIYEGVST